MDKYNLNGCIKFSLGKKLLHIFCMIYNFVVAVTRIHLTICEVQSNNLNPERIKVMVVLIITFLNLRLNNFTLI